MIPYFKKKSKFFDEILIKSGFFKYGFNFLFEYEWNNFYQESFLCVLKTLLDYSEYHELLFNYLFNDLKIFEIIKSHTNKENKFKFKHKDLSKDISHGYISFLISLCYKINIVIGGSPLRVNTNPSTEGSFEFLPKANEDNENNELFSMNEDDTNLNNDKKENKEEDIKKGITIESMKKYLNNDWTLFFNENISDVIKQYCDKNWPPKKEEMEIFDFLFQDNNDNDKDNNNEKKPEYKGENKEINNENKNENPNDNNKENKENDEKNKIEENKITKVEPKNANKEKKEEDDNKKKEDKIMKKKR